MQIYKVERTDKWGYDEYDSFVCIAPTPEAAKNTHPSDFYEFAEGGGVNFLFASGEKQFYPSDYRYTGWTTDLNNVRVTHLGEALSDKAEVVLASYNAG